MRIDNEERFWIDSVEGLLGLVDIGAVELQALNVSVDDLERPDQLVFSLPGKDWKKAVETATRATKVAAADRPSGAPPVAPLASEPKAGAPPLPTLIASPGSQPPAPKSRPWLHNTCIRSLAGTGVLGTVGLVFGWQANSAQAEVEGAMVWGPAAMSADARGRAYGQAATTLLISAGVTAAVAAVSCVATMRSR